MRRIYIEKKLGLFRQFEVDDNNIYINETSSYGREIDMSVSLSVLKPEPDTIILKKFRPGVAISLCIIILLYFLITHNDIRLFSITYDDIRVLSIMYNDVNVLFYESRFIPDVVILLLIGFGILFRTRIKIEYKQFINKDELYIFDIGKFGKHEKEFDEFIKLVIKKIKENAT